MYADSPGLCYCSQHRREVCQSCCVDHRVTNDITRAGPDADVDALMAKHEQIQDAEMRAMLAQHASEGGTGPVMLGSDHAQRLYDAAAARPPSGAEVCGHCQRGGKLLKCGRCRSALYCSREHQRADYSRHKPDCLRIAAAAQGAPAGVPAPAQAAPAPPPAAASPITWAKLEALSGMPATGKVLELRIMSQPIPFLRHAFEGKDRKGDVRRVAFYSDRVPPGLALGKVFRWRDPHFHYFVDGSSGARIEDEDVPNITVSDT